MDVKEIRGKLLLTQQQFADAVGVTRVMVVLWENGKYKPTPKNVKKILELCKQKGVE